MNDQHHSYLKSYESTHQAMSVIEVSFELSDLSVFPGAVREAKSIDDLPEEYKSIMISKLVGAFCMKQPQEDVHGIALLTHHLSTTKELQRQLYTDTVTGFANRRGLYDWASRCFDPHTNTYGVLAVDLTGFKKVNDTLGHTTGDAALKIACEVIASQTRTSKQEPEAVVNDERMHHTSDVLSVARIGGDEIICIMDFNGLDLALAHAAITRVVNHLESQKITMHNRHHTKSQAYGFRVGALLVGPSNPLEFTDALAAADDLCNMRRTSTDR